MTDDLHRNIDPGKNGSLAILQGEEVQTFRYDRDTYRCVLSDLRGEKALCCLEHVSAMPGQGVTSMFHFGEGFGWLQGMLEAYEIPYELVRPQKWKKEFGISGKNESIDVCRRLFPDVSLRRTERCRKEHDGMAEALLMAEYARRRLA